MAGVEPGRRRLGWRQALAVYGRAPVLAMAVLGFAAGLPFLLVGGTLSFWMREAGVDLKTIGFASWIGLAYSYKVLWSPLVDRMPIPVLTRRLGRRRAVMLLALLASGSGLAAMSFADPSADLTRIVALATVVAVASATFDIALDAFRIERLAPEEQGAGVGAYSVGYRVALLAAGAGALYLADFFDWATAYRGMALLSVVGIVAVLVVREHVDGLRSLPFSASVSTTVDPGTSGPTQRRRLTARLAMWMKGAVIAPFADFFNRNGLTGALLILAFIACFRLADLTLGTMANPFYVDVGFSKSDVAGISKVYGVIMTLLGGLLGGVLVARFGTGGPLIGGAVATAATNLLFAWIATLGPERWALALAISADNLAGGVAGAAFIAYLSGLTATAYTATQYALFSSLMTLPGNVIRGFTGIAAESLDWPLFFITSAAIGLPAVVLAIMLVTRTPPAAQHPAPHDPANARAATGRGSNSQ